MAKRRGANRGRNIVNSRRNNRALGANNTQQNGKDTVVQGWFTMSDKPKIAKAQNTYVWKRTVTIESLPGLAQHFAAHQNCEITSMGARFNPAYTHSPGLIGMLVSTWDKTLVDDWPVTPNHQFIKRNGGNIVRFSQRCSAPPSNNTVSQRTGRTCASAKELGELLWIWEGPQFTEDQSHVGEIEIYINIRFMGQK